MIKGKKKTTKKVQKKASFSDKLVNALNNAKGSNRKKPKKQNKVAGARG